MHKVELQKQTPSSQTGQLATRWYKILAACSPFILGLTVPQPFLETDAVCNTCCSVTPMLQCSYPAHNL